MTSETNQILARFSLESLVASRDLAVERYKAAAKAVSEARISAKEWEIGLPRVSVSVEGHDIPLWNHHDGCTSKRGLQAVDREYWRHMVDKSGIRDGMSTEAIRKMDDTIRGKDCPEFTQANIEATFAGLFANKEAMFGQLVLSVYRRISWDHKTNQPAQFGKKMILKSCSCYLMSTPWLDHQSPLLDLERALFTLDQQPLPTYDLSLARTIQKVDFGQWLEVAPTDQGKQSPFKVKVFMNRNGHVVVRS